MHQNCSSREKETKDFKDRFSSLIELVLPSPWTFELMFFSYVAYEESLLERKNKLQNIKG